MAGGVLLLQARDTSIIMNLGEQKTTTSNKKYCKRTSEYTEWKTQN